jgi:hypothetical protein
MPDVSAMALRSNPRVQSAGRLIKGLYYSDRIPGPHTMVAFYFACEQHLEAKPFLVMNFETHQFFLDRDRGRLHGRKRTNMAAGDRSRGFPTRNRAYGGAVRWRSCLVHPAGSPGADPGLRTIFLGGEDVP